MTQVVQDFDITVSGVRLRARRVRATTEAVCSSKLPIVFLHDSFGCIGVWKDFPQLVSAATGCDALIYDRQGYGQSDPFTKIRTPSYLEEEAVILAQVLYECGIGKAILFGHSDGGSIALIAAALSSEMVAGVITEGAHVFVEEITLQGIANEKARYLKMPTEDEKRNDYFGKPERPAKKTLRTRLQKYHGEKTDAMFSAWADTWLMDEFRDWDIEDFLPRITCPVLVLQGADDEYGSAAQVDAIATQTAGPSSSKLVDGVGHTPHKEAAEITLNLVADFVAEMPLRLGC